MLSLELFVLENNLPGWSVKSSSPSPRPPSLQTSRFPSFQASWISKSQSISSRDDLLGRLAPPPGLLASRPLGSLASRPPGFQISIYRLPGFSLRSSSASPKPPSLQTSRFPSFQASWISKSQSIGSWDSPLTPLSPLPGLLASRPPGFPNFSL